MENHKEERDERREARHQRRIRNQVIAYMVLIVILAGVGYGGYVGVNYLLDYLRSRETVQAPSPEPSAQPQEELAGVIATPEEIEEEPAAEEIPEEPVDENAGIKEMLASMTNEQKVANLFIVTPESITGVNKATMAGDGTRAALEKYAVGGILYRNQNISGADQFREMVKTTKEMYRSIYNVPLWAVVEEDGIDPVIACSMTGVQKPSSASKLGDSGDSGNAYTAYVDISNSLKTYQIDMNLGPVCSIKEEGNSFLGESAFSSDADITASMVKQAVDAQKESGILVCLQSFPGTGSADKDPQKGEAKTEKSLEDMRESEFLPFQSGIGEGADAVIVSHMTAENVSGESVPCSMSSVVINDILRTELGFEGLVITDYMNQAAVTSKYDAGDAAVKAIQAGADMILQPADFEAAYQAVLDAVNDGTITGERLEDALIHIYKLKKVP